MLNIVELHYNMVFQSNLYKNKHLISSAQILDYNNKLFSRYFNIYHITYQDRTICRKKLNTLKKSPITSNILKKAFKNDPPTTLPQCLVINLVNGLTQ